MLVRTNLAYQINVRNDQRHHLFAGPQRFWLNYRRHWQLVKSMLGTGSLHLHAKVHHCLFVDKVVFSGEKHNTKEGVLNNTHYWFVRLW